MLKKRHYISNTYAQCMGRPGEKDRQSIARAFIAKAVFDYPTTEMLIDAPEPAAHRCEGCLRI